MALRSLNYLSLCTGGAGLDLGVELAIPSARAVCLLEREAFACATLVEAMRQGLLAPAPLWSDVRSFRGRAWRGLVDGLIGGIPCQPHSLAGKRLGAEDERDLWADARRIIVQSGVWWVLIENVEGMLSSGGAERVWRDLGRLGFACEVGLFSASEVGAPHERKRVFILGVADRHRREGERLQEHGDIERPLRREPDRCGDRHDGSGTLADTGLLRCASRWPHEDAGDRATAHRRRPADQPGGRVASLADASEPGLARNPAGEVAGSQQPAAERGGGALVHPERPERGPGTLGGHDPNRSHAGGREAAGRPGESGALAGLFPPGPGDRDAWARIAERDPTLLPALPQSALRLLADGMASGLGRTRIDELRLLGNGVVPIQAAHAVRTLSRALANREIEGGQWLWELCQR